MPKQIIKILIAICLKQILQVSQFEILLFTFILNEMQFRILDLFYTIMVLIHLIRSFILVHQYILEGLS